MIHTSEWLHLVHQQAQKMLLSQLPNDSSRVKEKDCNRFDRNHLVFALSLLVSDPAHFFVKLTYPLITITLLWWFFSSGTCLVSEARRADVSVLEESGRVSGFCEKVRRQAGVQLLRWSTLCNWYKKKTRTEKKKLLTSSAKLITLRFLLLCVVGLPHYGHLLCGTIKDVVTRYAHQTGHHVVRRFGWVKNKNNNNKKSEKQKRKTNSSYFISFLSFQKDTHGLPIEFEIDKKFGVKTREDVLKMGIDRYNEECRSIVMTYANEWEHIVTRMGRWIDFRNDYKTLNLSFMESVWWVFAECWYVEKKKKKKLSVCE